MKFFPLLWSGMWRKPVRTALVFLQVMVAFTVFGVLQGMKTGMDRAVANARADVLYVTAAVAGATPLPLAYAARLRSMPGVKTVTFGDRLLGTYQKPTQDVYVLALDERALNLVPEVFEVPPRDAAALQSTRTGALISADIGRKYGWRVGDRIPITSTTLQKSGSGTWLFDIVGTFIDHEPGEAGFIVVNYGYLDEARALDQGTVRNFYVLVADPKAGVAVSDAIDHTFANSSGSTRTATFRESAQQQLESLGDLDFAIRTILSAVLAALLFSISTMTMQSVRERTAEFAVLEALGFTRRAIYVLLAAEALLVCLGAAVSGLALAWLAFPLAGKYVPGLSMPVVIVGLGILGAVLVALISVSAPSLRLSRLNLVDALARR
jgi:putative ABC transport system permease protein